MEVSCLSVQGNQQNEDFVYGNQQIGIVIDGASGLYQQQVTSFASDAQWFSHSLGQLLAASLSDMSKSLPTLISEACQALLSEWRELLIAQELSFSEEMLPNATLSVVRFNLLSKQLELFQLGDSPIMLATTKGLCVMDDEKLAANDKRVLLEMCSLAEKHQISICAARELVTAQLQENRRQRNTAATYWILDPLGKGIKHGAVKTLPLSEVQGVVIMSDGLWEAYDVFHQYDSPEHFFAHISECDNLADVVTALRVKQKEDRSLTNYPRFKLMDDATVLLYK